MCSFSTLNTFSFSTLITKRGYKRTEVGIIPEDWEVKRLGDFSQFRNGLNFVKSDRGDIVRVVGVADFQSRFRVTYDQLGTVQIAGSLSNDDLLKSGDLSFVRSNGNKALIGRCVLIEELTEPVSFSGFTIRTRVSHTVAIPAFVGRYFQSTAARQQIKEAGEGSHISNLSQQVLAAMKLPVPAVAEQKAISEALSDADALIESLEHLVVKKRQVKQGAMQELLTGKRRLAGFSQSASRWQSEVGSIPTDWTVCPLGRLVHSVEYGSSAKSRRLGLVPVIRMGNLQDGKIAWDDLVYTNDETEIEKYSLHPGDILFNRTNTVDLVGKTAIYDGDRKAIFAGYLIRINLLSELLNARYLNYILNAEFARKYSAKVLSVAVGQANINGQKLKTYPIPLPPTKSEQDAIASALTDMDAEITAVEAKLSKARHLKQAMMQELLTGRTRLV